MKQSNIILGIGILVAIIIIAGSLFLNAGPREDQSAVKQIKAVSSISKSAKNIVAIPFNTLSRHFIKVH